MKKIFLETTYTNLHLHVPFADATPLSPPQTPRCHYETNLAELTLSRLPKQFLNRPGISGKNSTDAS